MKKTTIYLPDDLKQRLEDVARLKRCSETELFGMRIAAAVATLCPPRPRAPLPGVSLGDPSIAERAEELLQG